VACPKHHIFMDGGIRKFSLGGRHHLNSWTCLLNIYVQTRVHVACTGTTVETDREMEDYKGWGTSHMLFESGEGSSRTIDCKLHWKVYLRRCS
jgi:hypothetical protein